MKLVAALASVAAFFQAAPSAPIRNLCYDTIDGNDAEGPLRSDGLVAFVIRPSARDGAGYRLGENPTPSLEPSLRATPATNLATANPSPASHVRDTLEVGRLQYIDRSYTVMFRAPLSGRGSCAPPTTTSASRVPPSSRPRQDDLSHVSLDAEPRSPRKWLAAANGALALGDFERANGQYAEALKRCGEDGWARCRARLLRALLRVRQGRTGEAREDIRTAVAADGPHVAELLSGKAPAALSEEGRRFFREVAGVKVKDE